MKPQTKHYIKVGLAAAVIPAIVTVVSMLAMQITEIIYGYFMELKRAISLGGNYRLESIIKICLYLVGAIILVKYLLRGTRTR